MDVHLSPKPYLAWPVVPYQGFRLMDAWGGGSFGAPRAGKENGHPGVDCVGEPGNRIVIPIVGAVSHIGIAYPGELLGSIHIKGVGLYDGWRVKLFYVEAVMPRHAVLGQGMPVGVLQDRSALARKRNPKRGPMINHVHLGLWIDGELVDPTEYLRRPLHA